MSFTAKYHGRCSSCSGLIEPGDEVNFDVDGELVHVHCEPGTDPDEPSRTEHRCPDCWTWHAGECL